MTLAFRPAPAACREVTVVANRQEAAWFSAAAVSVYRDDPCWTPPLPGEEQDTFDPRHNLSLRGVQARRWVLRERGRPVARIAAFTAPRRPGTGYFGFFECPDDADSAALLLGHAEAWLAEQGCGECYGPVAVNPRDRIGLLIEGFDQPALLFTPYNPAWYGALLERAGYTPRVFLRGYGWSPGHGDPRQVAVLARRLERDATIRLRPLRLERLREETRLIAALVNETMADAWHYEPIGGQEADQMARLLRPILDPEIALVAEDEAGPCGVALAVPDINWLWRRAGARLWPLGWMALLRWRRHIPVARVMALGLSRRVRGSSVAVRMIGRLHATGLARGYTRGEMSQVFDDNHAMRRILDRMGFPVVRRYAVFHRSLRNLA